MKQFVLGCCMLVTLLSGCVQVQREQPDQIEEPTYQVFYDQLSPYGRWVSNPTFGYIWVPAEDMNTFMPYGSNGYWEWTQYGWTWVSNYPWGWAPFHYGRWNFDPGFGWYWIPDGVWGPAWVSWCESPGYYGWAPMGPGVTISYISGGGYDPPDSWWTFCDDRHFGDRDLHNYYQSRGSNRRIRGESRGINNTQNDKSRGAVYLSGPDKDEVGKFTGVPVQRIPITDRQTPGQFADDHEVSVYRPIIVSSTPFNVKPAPRAIYNGNTLPSGASGSHTTSPNSTAPIGVSPDRRLQQSTQPTQPAQTQQSRQYQYRGTDGGSSERSNTPVQTQRPSTNTYRPPAQAPEHSAPAPRNYSPPPQQREAAPKQSAPKQ
ncbi:MAG TPA: DUF6600 domain-containing protein [Candidatus Kapabacteria bacterium]|nr:DUF6600 domain-containing protein [Candidatus Kapabacteria bacterium]